MDMDLHFKNGNPGAVQYGNFINYYQFHPPENRIRQLSKDIWGHIGNEQNFHVIDIGCNAGDLTQSLYDFLTDNVSKNCYILGIDIDQTLIERANEKNTNANITFACMDIMNENSQNIIKDYLNKFNITKFQTVFCFSITMWIHLNHGDEGLHDFLRVVSEMSEILVIEPQPWKCYKTAVKRMKSSNSNGFLLFKDLKIREQIEDNIELFLINKCGLVKIKESLRTEWGRKLLFFSKKFGN